MKKSCSAALLVLLFALFANAQEVPPQEVPPQEVPPPLPKDSSLAMPPDASPASPNTSQPKKIEKKAEEKKASAKRDEFNPEDYQKNLRVMAYFHPIPLFWGAAYNMFMFNSTFEIPLSLRNSVVVQPTAWFGSSDVYMPNMTIFLVDNGRIKYEKLIRIGSGIGIRHYALDKGQGFYLQSIASAYYFSAKSLSYRTDDDFWKENENKVKGMVGELMFYMGSTHKWQNVGFFYEVGLGFGYDDTKTQQLGYINRLATNFNIGVGIPL